jgi:general secretion pathway protein J
MAITAIIAVLSYQGLATVINGVEGLRDEMVRSQDIDRVFRLLSRDVRQLVPRPIIDEFQQVQSPLTGGPLAPEWLSMTRGGWHNTTAAPRSHLERVGYRLIDDTLYRVRYPVLDRLPNVIPEETPLLEGVETLRVRFLDRVENVSVGRNLDVDRRQWIDSWVADVAQVGATIDPPAALVIELEVTDFGRIERVYVLPPL